MLGNRRLAIDCFSHSMVKLSLLRKGSISPLYTECLRKSLLNVVETKIWRVPPVFGVWFKRMILLVFSMRQVKPIFIESLTTGIMKVVNDALSHYPIGNLTSAAAEFDNWL